MKIEELFKNTTIVLSSSEVGEIEVTGMTADSRVVKPGNIFFALPGPTVDGHRFIDEAVSRGASLVILEDPRFLSQTYFPYGQSTNIKQDFSIASNNFFHTPSRDISLTGITGTNGKTRRRDVSA